MLADSGALAPALIAAAKWIKTTEDVEELSEMDEPRRHSLKIRVYAVHLGETQLLTNSLPRFSWEEFYSPGSSG